MPTFGAEPRIPRTSSTEAPSASAHQAAKPRLPPRFPDYQKSLDRITSIACRILLGRR